MNQTFSGHIATGGSGGRGGDVGSHNNVTISANTIVYHDKDPNLREKIYTWLGPPDPSRNLNEACEKRTDRTGAWLIEGVDYKTWIVSGGFLCLFGKAGCGKTILSSTVVVDVMKHCAHDNAQAYAYFYFDRRDSQTALQVFRNFILSLIAQLLSQLVTIPESLVRLHETRQQPLLSALEELLVELFDRFHQVYVIIDSLDECSERARLIKWLVNLVTSANGKLHLLATSRPEPDICRPIITVTTCVVVDVDDEGISRDMFLHVDEMLGMRWTRSGRAEIKHALLGSGESGGAVFRLLDYQLKALQKCATLREAKKKLQTLPHTLRELYEGILLNLQDGCTHALALLTWLAFSVRPLTLEEIAEIGIVILGELDHDGLMSFDEDGRLPEEFILGACSDLVTIYDGYVKLVHLSIKEHLFSVNSTSTFKMSEAQAHIAISQSCLVYIMYCAQSYGEMFDEEHSRSESNYEVEEFNDVVEHDIEEPNLGVEEYDAEEDGSEGDAEPFPLLRYADEEVMGHVCNAGGDSVLGLQDLLETFFTADNPAFLLWRASPSHYNWDLHATPIYYACKLSFEPLARRLWASGADLNAPGGRYGSPLQAAAYEGHSTVVNWLLEHGADVNVQGGSYNNALQAAALNNHEEIVQLLIEQGADVNVVGGDYGTPLQAAIYCSGHYNLIRLLLEEGADPNAQGGFWGLALTAAAGRGDIRILRLLIEKGADVCAPGSNFGNALVVAAGHGHTEVVCLLLEKGMEVNDPGRDKFRSTLLTPVCKGNIKMVRLLLDNGADVNAYKGCALKKAVQWRHADIVRLLLDNGADADINVLNASLRLAIHQGHTDLVPLLQSAIDAYEVDYDTSILYHVACSSSMGM